jgi:cobyrinic acid a,c-diamide synthase
MHTRPVGHGYTEVVVDRDNPFFDRGLVIRGHEFHYSGPVISPGDEAGCMTVKTGVGLGNRRDGLVFNNSLATYSHLHASGVKQWATGVLSRARRYRSGRAEAAGDERPDRTQQLMETLEKAEARVSPGVSGCL